MQKPLDRRIRNREHDARRRADKPWRAWYKLPAWIAARAAQLVRDPLCERCVRRGLVVPAGVVNHRRPHKGDWSLFIDSANHESVCAGCHDSPIQREERGGGSFGVDAAGRPTAPDHPWNAR